MCLRLFRFSLFEFSFCLLPVVGLCQVLLWRHCVFSRGALPSYEQTGIDAQRLGTIGTVLSWPASDRSWAKTYLSCSIILGLVIGASVDREEKYGAGVA
jgi:hypothetical protein